MELKYLLYQTEEFKSCKEFSDMLGRLKKQKALPLGTVELKSVADSALFLGHHPDLLQQMRSRGIATLACDLSKKNLHDPIPELRKESVIVEGFADLDEDFLTEQYQRFHGIPWTVFTTDRCVVRELSLSDLPALFTLYQKPHMTDYIEPLLDRDEELEYQRAYIKNIYHFYGFGMWLVFEKKSGILIGRAGLEPKEEGIELGYMIAPEFQNRGYAFEVCEGVLRYGREKLELDNFQCCIDPNNRASIGLAQKLGFVHVGKMHMGKKEFEKFILYSKH